MEDRGLVEAGEVGHVFLLVKLGRVHLLDVVFGDELSLSSVDDLDFDLVASVLLDGGRHEAVALVRDPDELFLGPFCLGRGVVEGPPVDDQVLQVGVQPVDDFSHVGRLSRKRVNVKNVRTMLRHWWPGKSDHSSGHEINK